ncbi:MAG: hypothetical protein QF704_11910 [Anaerolineales bacterium]|jgi:hypothetical protein|nr:hypothetical protein [Anaerolineales bacterium]
MSQVSIAACNAGNDAINTLLNGGSVEIKSGAEPDIDGAPSGTVLAVITLANPAFGASSGRTATLNPTASTNALVANAGTPVHYVAKDSGSTIQASGTAGLSGTDMILNTLTWGIGDAVSITSWTATLPK